MVTGSMVLSFGFLRSGPDGAGPSKSDEHTKQLMVVDDGDVVAVNKDRKISVRPPQPGETTLISASPRFGIQYGNASMSQLIDLSSALPVMTVLATKSDDGQELWSAEVPGEPLDLAWSDGCLVVVCDSGTVICFSSRGMR